MSTFYLDYENGNDSNDGSTWALAWKTTTNGATAARIAPGDIIRVAKSPAPYSIGNATWTNGSYNLTLASAQTQTIDNCETLWNGTTNVTVTRSSSTSEVIQGSYAAKAAIASAFTTGKIMYNALSSTLDLSSYQQINFCFSAGATAAGVYKICLCSDTAGDTVVDEFVIPYIPRTAYSPFTLSRTGGGNLGSNINSIAVYAVSDPGAVSIVVDNFFASVSGGLNLLSLISKNSTEQGGSEVWYTIHSIDGTNIVLGQTYSFTVTSSLPTYCGTTETVTTYARETIKTTIVGSTSDSQTIQDSGTEGNYIEFQGGYNTSTSIQEGETIFDGNVGCGYCFSLSTKSYVKFNHIGGVRYNYNFYLSGSTYNIMNNFISCSNAGVIGMSTNPNYNYIDGLWSSYNLVFSTTNPSYGWEVKNCKVYASAFATLNGAFRFNISDVVACGASLGISLNNGSANNKISNCTINSITNAVICSNSGANNRFYNCLFTSTNPDISAGTNIVYLYNTSLLSTGETTGTAGVDYRVFSNRHDNTDNNHWIFTDGGTINSQTTERHTASGIAWKINVTTNIRTSLYPLDFSIAKIAVTANNLVTVSAWMKKDHATNIVGKLLCEGGQIAGVSSDVTSTAAESTDWQEVTITFTPTENGVVEIKARAIWGGDVANLYVDDLTITQA